MRDNLTAIENDFPIAEISKLALHESWRKEICRPIYYIHKWWARRLGSIFRAIILGSLNNSDIDIWENFYKLGTLKGKVVLDPFMGSGVTIGESIKLGAMAIGCDTNPISSFMVRQEFADINENLLKEEFYKLEKKVAPHIKHYYTTNDPETGELIPVLYYFWIMTVPLPSGQVIPLFSKYVFAQNARPTLKPKAWIYCPHCSGIFSDRYDIIKTRCPKCGNIFNPQHGPAKGQYVCVGKDIKYKIKDLIVATAQPPQRKMYALLALKKNGEKIYLSPSSHDYKLYEEASEKLKNENLPLPIMEVRPGYNTNQALSYNYKKWSDFFNDRQLLCLGILLKGITEIKDSKIREQMLCLFSGVLEFNNMFCSFKGEGTGATRHMFSHHILKPEKAALENSVWGTKKSSGTFSTLFESRLLRARKYLKEPFEMAFGTFQNTLLDTHTREQSAYKRIASKPIKVSNFENWHDLITVGEGILILNGDSSNLALPNNSVDAIITDPPYFDFINYSELSDFFFAWLSPVLKESYNWMRSNNCFNPGEVQNCDQDEFIRRLTNVFKEGNRVLKDNGILAFSFHHSRPEGWVAIYEAIRNAEFRITATYPVHSEMRVATPLSGAKEPISIDAIIICRKEEQCSYRETLPSAESQILKLKKKGIDLSKSDIFVINAAITLLKSSKLNHSSQDVIKELNNFYNLNF